MTLIRLFERFSLSAPTLEGRSWEEARAQFQEWVEMVVSILDSLSRVSVDASVVVVTPGGGGSPPPIVIAPDPSDLGFTPRPPLAHTHLPIDVVGLPADDPLVLAIQTFARRPQPRSDEVLGLVGDVQVVLAGQTFARRPQPRSDEVIGLVGDSQVILAAQVFGP